MKNDEKEIKNLILKKISDYKKTASYHKGEVRLCENRINKLNSVLGYFIETKNGVPKKSVVNTGEESKGKKHGGFRPNAGRKKAITTDKTVKIKTKKSKVPIVKWGELIFSLLEKTGKPMSANEIIHSLFKGRRKETKSLLRKRISSALSSFKKKGKLDTIQSAEHLYYGLPNF